MSDCKTDQVPLAEEERRKYGLNRSLEFYRMRECTPQDVVETAQRFAAFIAEAPKTACKRKPRSKP